MRDERNKLAVVLRMKGLSIKSIAKELSAAQSSVSLWTRNVQLTEEQIQHLRANMHTPEAIEKRRQARLKSEAAKRAVHINQAKSQIKQLSKRDLWMIGVALYWGEGTKNYSTVQFTNGDPKMIVIFLRFLHEICNVSETKLRANIHIHEHLETKDAEEFWQAVTGIPKDKFYKTYSKPNKSSKGTRNSLPHGVCTVYVLDAKLLLKIKGWTEGIYESAAQMLK